jgi:PAS domain S-box-containing protein
MGVSGGGTGGDDQRAEARYRNLVEAAPAGLYRTDAEGRGIYVNEALCRLTGRDAAFLTGDGWAEIVHPDDRERVVREYVEGIEAGVPFHAEFRYLRPDGTVVWVHVVSLPERDPDGTVAGYVGTVHDVTVQHRAQDAMNALAEASAAPGGMEAFQQVCVQALARTYGARYAFVGWIDDAEATRMRTLAMWDAETGFGENFTYDLAGTPCGDVLENGITLVADRAAERYPDDPFMVTAGIESYFAAPLTDGAGGNLGLVGVADVNPITPTPWSEPILASFARRIAAEMERDRAESRLRASEASLALAQAIAHVGHWEWDAAANASRKSDEAWRILGMEPAEGGLSDEAFLALIHPDDRLEVRARLGDALDPEKRAPFSVDFRVVLPSGEVRHVHEQADTTFDGDGRPVRMVGTIQDVSDLARAQEARERAQAQLLQAQKMEAVGLLAGGVAHDFNNLLTTIMGYAELAAQRTGGPEDPLGSHLAEIRRAAERAAALTRQLLLFSRRQPMAFVPQDLKARVGDLVRMLGRLIGERVEVATELADDLWPVRADGVSIDQMIVNLAINARDAMPDGGRLTIGAENVTLSEADAEAFPEGRAGQVVRLAVSDTGTGMDPETLARVFEPFFTTKEPGQGTGLGMSVAHGIARQHGGWIGAESTPGKGTTFAIFLPRVGEEVVAEAPREAPPEVDGAGRRVLVVEDEPAVLAFAHTALTRGGYEVTAAGTAREALALFEREEGAFALVFSDVVLPDQNGLKLVDELQSRRADVNVLLCSGYPDPQAGWAAVEERGLRFIQKPYSLAALLAAVADGIAAADGDGHGDGGRPSGGQKPAVT